MYCICVLGISVLFTIGGVMYYICVLGDICFIYYWRSDVLYMCARGYQFYLLLEKSCTVYACWGISVLFTIGEVMYCICVLGNICFIYYWRIHVLYMCVRDISFIYCWGSHVLFMCVRGYQFYSLLEKWCTVYVC